jgi:hypothetical protein
MRQGNVTERGTKSVVLPEALFALFMFFFFHEKKRSEKTKVPNFKLILLVNFVIYPPKMKGVKGLTS